MLMYIKCPIFLHLSLCYCISHFYQFGIYLLRRCIILFTPASVYIYLLQELYYSVYITLCLLTGAVLHWAAALHPVESPVWARVLSCLWAWVLVLHVGQPKRTNLPGIIHIIFMCWHNRNLWLRYLVQVCKG